MTDNSKGLVVSHRVQKSGIDPYASVRACEGVHFVRLIDFEVKRCPVHRGDPRCHLPDPLDIWTCLRQNSVLGVQLLYILADVGLDLGIGQGRGLGYFGAAGKEVSGVELFRARDAKHRGCQQDYNLTHDNRIL